MEVVAHADLVLAQIDQTALAAYFGRRPVAAAVADAANAAAAVEAAAAAAALKKTMEERRNAVRDAWYRKARAFADLAAGVELQASPAVGGAEDAAAANEAAAVRAELQAKHQAAFAELRSWLNDKDDAKLPKEYAPMQAALDRRQRRWGAMLKAVNEQTQADGDSPKLAAERVALLRDLGWHVWANHERNWSLVRFQSAFAAF